MFLARVRKRALSWKKSGVLGGGGLGVTFGAQKQTLESDKTKFYAQGSQVGSLNGNTTLIAKNHYTQTASQVSAVNGDVNILAKNVDIKAADDKYETNTKQTFEQKGGNPCRDFSDTVRLTSRARDGEIR